MIFPKEKNFTRNFIYELVFRKVKDFPFMNGSQSKDFWREFSQVLRQESPEDYDLNVSRILFTPSPGTGDFNRFYRAVGAVNQDYPLLIHSFNPFTTKLVRLEECREKFPFEIPNFIRTSGQVFCDVGEYMGGVSFYE